MSERPTDDERVVQLTSTANFFEADVLVALLRSNGVEATTPGGQGYGYFHQMDCPVFVLEHDLTRAREILDSRPEPFPDR